MTARVIPIRAPSCFGTFRSPQSDAENGCRSCRFDTKCAAQSAPLPCPHYLAERAALAVMAAWGEARAQRAELIRAAAAGDAKRAQEAMKGWNDER